MIIYNNTFNIPNNITSCIYGWHNIITNKWYIGMTKNLKNRMMDYHKLNFKYQSNFYKSIKKHGLQNFVCYILEVCDQSILSDREKYWIKEKNSMTPNGYNLTSGGEGGYIRSDETKEKIRLALTGKKLSLETKQKMSNAIKNRNPVDAEKLKSIRSAHIIKRNTGAVFTKERLKNMSISQIGNVRSLESRKKQSDTMKMKSLIKWLEITAPWFCEIEGVN